MTSWGRSNGWPLTRYPHLVLYAEQPDHAEVSRVLQGARNLPWCLSGSDLGA